MEKLLIQVSFEIMHRSLIQNNSKNNLGFSSYHQFEETENTQGNDLNIVIAYSLDFCKFMGGQVFFLKKKSLIDI